MTRRLFILTAGAFIAACGDDSPGQNNNACPDGFELRGRACVPIFDDCPGRAEIPVLGGGCQPVGVTECATGFVSDGEGGCDPILPSEPCPPGTMEVIGQTECQPVGVVQCADGFVSDGEGGCDAILPSDPCAFGTMEVLGYTECQPIGDCGTGTWGNITTDATTVFVDVSADATSANGSQSNPFTTINGALAVVEPGGQIAVAAGEYVERLVINEPVELVGRCADLVTIRGTIFLGQERPPVTVNAGGSGAIVRGLTLTGAAEGLVIRRASSVVVEEVQVVDTGSRGIQLTDEAEASFRRVVVAGCANLGVSILGSSADLFESVVRDTQPDGDGRLGRGINAECDWSGNCSLSVAASLVAGNRGVGIGVFGVDTIVTSTVVRDTLSRESDGTSGRGILAQCHPDVGICGSLSVAASLVAANASTGIIAFGVDAAVTSTVVRDTQTDGNGHYGRGIGAQCYAHVGICGTLSVERSVVATNRDQGIFVWGADATVTSTIVRDTRAGGDGYYGQGIGAQCHPDMNICGSLSVERSLVAANMETGIAVAGVDAAVTSTVVRDTHADADGYYGRGMEVHCDSRTGVCGSLTVERSLVATNRDTGIIVVGVETTVTSTVVRDTQPGRNGDGGRGIAGQCHPNVGSCGSLSVERSVVAANRDLGIAVFGVDTTVASTVVRDTLPRESDGKFGRGINAQCDQGLGGCGSLSVTGSVVSRSLNVGVFVHGVPAVLEGVAVLDTRPSQQAPWTDDYGQGIWALCDDLVRACGSLTMTSCLVDSSHTAGLAVLGVPGSVESSVIRSALPRPLDGAYGYGIQVEGLESLQPLGFHIRSCVIRDASLASVVYVHAGGIISSTSTSGGQYAVVANTGCSPEVTDDNDLLGTVQSGLYWGNMDPSPAPAPTLPIDSAAGSQ